MLTMTPEILSEKVRNYRGRSPGGIACQFIKLDEKWGIKKYSSKKTRDRAYAAQKKMAEVGCAPQVGASFNVDEWRFCYVTEVAQPLMDGYDGSGNWLERYGESDKLKADSEVLRWMDNALDEMAKHNYYMSDAHLANFGILGNKVVCIDFGNDNMLLDD